MSLLMEALRKAEDAKRRMQEQAAASRDSRELVAAPPVSNSAGSSGSAFTLEERDSELTPEYIRDNFTSAQNLAATAESPVECSPERDSASAADAEPEYARQAAVTPATPALARRQQRAAAASVFTAKQHPARDRKVLTVLVLVMVLMIPAGSAVLWYLHSATTSSIGLQPALANYDLSSRELGGEVAAAAVPEAAPASTAQNPLVESVAQTTAAAQPAAAGESSTSESQSGAEPVAPPEERATASPAAEPQVATAPAPATPAVAAPIAGETQVDAAATTSVLEISRSRSSSQVNPELVAAYESLQAGDLATARRLYQQLLGELPNNRDALLGLASITLREGDAVGARGLYTRLLQLNPQDPLAHTGLLQTMQANDAAEHERTLKSLIARYPDVAQLTLALGNLYASQQRWSEAQGAYYNALLTASRSTSGPVHPDYAFNLAVSLEQLNEPRAALDYYRRAQALAAEVTPGFDPQLLNSRLDYLSMQAQP